MGAWTTKVPGLESLPLEVTEETVAYFEPKPAAADADADEQEPIDHTYKRMPVFVHRAPNGIQGRADQGFYGLPEVEVRGVKVAAHHVGPVVDPDARLAARQRAEAEGAAAEGHDVKEQREKVG